jgi:hypothetical protein
MGGCQSFRHDFTNDPRPAEWRDATCTCTRCGEVRNALTGQTIKEAN